MPTYQPAERGAQLSWELLEGVVTVPLERALLSAFEIYHPLSGRHRYVADEQNLLATIEPGAPADANEEVLWEALPVTVGKPEQSAAAASPNVSLSLDNVAGLMAKEMDKTRGSLDPWVVTERLYASDDTGGPAVLPPTVMYISNVRLQDAAVVITASYGEPANVDVPKTTFNRFEYPGLMK